jgi:fructose-1,6-bisphosphatase I
LNSVSTACKWITNVVRKAELLKVLGVTGTTNVQQENVQKLDILSNEIMVNMLLESKKCAILISEEVDEVIPVPDKSKGHYCVVFDPLDGSSNIDCGVSVGTIFGIYRLDTLSEKPLLEQVLEKKGSDMVCGGYCMYGSCSVLVMAIGGEANGYTLDPNIGEFVLTHPKVSIDLDR